MLERFQRIDLTYARLAADGPRFAILASMAGMLAILVSSFVGVMFVQFDGSFAESLGQAPVSVETPKEVGYLAALNWSLHGFVIGPLIIYFAMAARAEIAGLRENLIDLGMVVHKDWTPATKEEFEAAWRPFSAKVCGWSLLIAAIAGAFVVSDFVNAVAIPLFNPEVAFSGINLNDAKVDFDWSIAAHLGGVDVDIWMNFAFGLAVYVLFALGISAFAFYSITYFLGFALFMGGSPMHRHDLYVVPHIQRGDSRRGFELFGDYFFNMFCAIMAILIGLYLLHVQNVYLRTPDAASLFGLIAGDIRQVYDLIDADSAISLTKIKDVMFATPFMDDGDSTIQNIQTAVALTLGPFIIIIVVALSFITLRRTAVQGRQRWEKRFSTPQENLPEAVRMDDAALDKAEDYIDDMEIWPVKWISLNRLTGVMTLILASFIFHRLILLFLVLGVFALLKMAFFSKKEDKSLARERRRARRASKDK